MVTQTHNFRVLQTNSMRFFKQISTINSMIFKTMDNELKVFGKTILTTTEHLKNLETVNATVYNKNGQFNLQGLSINTSQSVSNFTKLNNAFKAYNSKYKIDKNVDSATADKISEAQGYWNNYLQTLETIDQLEDERESAEDTYANKVIDHYNKQIEKQQKLLNLREKFVSIRATWSDFANTASDYRYEQSKNMEQIKTYDNAIAKYRSLQKTVTEGSDAWNTYNDQIKDNQDKIQELVLSNAELSKSIMNLPLDNASKKIEKYSNNLSLLQTKYSSLNMADSKNKNIDLQQKQSANIKAANDAALKEANANLNSAWAAIRTKDLKTINKNAKKGTYLIQASDTREGYKAIVEYNNALTAQKKAYEEAEKASAEYYRTVQENTKNKWDNIINQYQTNYDYFNSKSSRASAYLDYRKSMGYSNTSIYQENAYKDQLQAQKDALAELEEERGKLDWNKIQKQYEAGELQRDDYFALAKTIKELDSSIYKANGNNDIGYSEEEYADDMRQYISDMWNAVSESKSASDEIVKIYQEQGQLLLIMPVM